MSESRESFDGRRIRNPSEVAHGTQRPGDFAWEHDFTHFEHGAKETDETLTLYICMPGGREANGSAGWTPIHVRRGPPPTDRVWGWDGNLDKPTLQPSIHQPGCWHGHLQAGYFRSI